jgi:hypothetical protein
MADVTVKPTARTDYREALHALAGIDLGGGQSTPS